MDSQFKFGADASVAFAYGAGVEGSTTAALGADIVSRRRHAGCSPGCRCRAA